MIKKERTEKTKKQESKKKRIRNLFRKKKE